MFIILIYSNKKFKPQLKLFISADASSVIHGRQWTYELSKLFNHRLHAKSLKYGERLLKPKLYALQERRGRYIIIYIWKLTQQMVPNIDCKMGHSIKTRNHERFKAQRVIEYSTNRNPGQSLKKCNN